MSDQTAAERTAEVLHIDRFRDIPMNESVARAQAAALMADPDLLVACVRQAVSEGATIDADAVVDLAIEAGGLEPALGSLLGEHSGWLALYAADDPDCPNEVDVWRSPDDAARHVPLYRRREAPDA